MKRDRTEQNWNFPKVVLVIFLFLMSILFLAFAYLSLSPNVLGHNMQAFAANRNTYSTKLTANRGTIYDSDGNTLALNVYSYTVIAYLDSSRTTDISKPNHVVDVKTTAEKLSPLLNMEVETLTKLMSQEKLYQVELGPGGRNITEIKKDEIEKLNLPGIDFIESSKRFYPNGDFASYVIGYAKTNEHTDESGKITTSIDGELGIESKYDELLKGKDGYLSYQQDRFGYKIPETREDRVDPLNGSNIYLTINASIQRFLEEAMDEAEQNYKYEWLQLHIMDAETGDILASASSPSFDPNIRNLTNYENLLTSVLYEPGSVMKTFTYACAMEKGTYQGDKTFESGTITVGDTYIKDWNNRGWGTITYDYGYVQSSNVGITNILLGDNFIDKNDLKQCYDNYGFGKLTNIELPREASGKLEFNYPVEVAAAGYGQGIYTTPVQILQAYSIFANDGKMLTPHIIKKIVDENTNEIIYERQIEQSEQLVSTATVDKLKTLMNDVINSTTGSGHSYSVESSGIDFIGKTGTAQIFENGSYLRNQYIRSIAGMFPKENPKIIIYGAVKKASPDVSTVLSKAIKKVIQNISKYLNLYDNSEANSLKEYNVANYVSKTTSGVTKAIEELGLKPILAGEGDYIINQYPNVGTKIIEGEKVFLLTNDNTYKMPNMTSWSRSDVINYFNLIGAKYIIEGNGYVTSQSLPSNNVINKEEVITITLSSKY